MKLNQIDIRSFRSVTNFKIPFGVESLNILCGANNVGKTNVLRAIYLFFKADIVEFDGKNDVPYHIAEGVRGDAYKVEVTGHFSDGNYAYEISVKFIPENRNSAESLTIFGVKRDITIPKTNIPMSEGECTKILDSFRVIFIGANNIDLPGIVSDIFVTEVLTDLDKLRKKQITSLDDLKKFQESSHSAMSSIEANLTKQIQSFSNIDGIGLSEWKAKIRFPEFNKLRDAISKLVDFTILDTNDLTLDFKGSGAQKIVLLAIMRYMAQEKSQNIIWLLDEPEAFLQPALQKRVFSELKLLSKDIRILITTHSQYFVDPADVIYTHLLVSDQKEKEYKRKSGRAFILNSAKIDQSTGSGKIEKIKSHLGINSSDTWTVLPVNIIVEGDDDKSHIVNMLNKLDLPIPNLLVCGGIDRLKGYLAFLSEFSDGSSYKPKFICVLDHDEAGKRTYSSLNAKDFPKIDVNPMYVARTIERSEEKFDFEFEDMIPHVILLDAINKVLRKKGYATLRRNALESRYSPAYDSSCVLNRVNSIAKDRNSDKDPINFENINMKLWINRNIQETISNLTREDFAAILENNLGLKKFLHDVSGYAN